MTAMPSGGDEPGDFGKIVAVSEAEGGGAEDVAQRARPRRPGLRARLRQRPDQPVEGFRGAPVLLLLVGGQFERDHRHGQAERGGKPARIVLDQLGGAGGPDDHRLGPEALVGRPAGVLEQPRGVAAQVAGLERGVGHGRAAVAPLDHGEEQVGIGVALRGMEHVVQTLHGGGDPHGADMGRSLVGPHGQLHGYTASFWRRASGRAKSSARSPA